MLQERELFQPRERERVEVSFSEGDEVESWWEGEIIQGKGDFFLVSFSDNPDANAREIVERDRIRPAYGHTPAYLEKVPIPIRPDLQVFAHDLI